MTNRSDTAALQVPSPGALTLDHVAHFVRDIDAASAALERLGFTLTPFSEQSHRLEADGPLVSAGTGNRCVMFERGYVEFLTAFGDTPIADQLRVAMHRYVGVHLVAFGSAAPDADHARLKSEHFEPLAPVALQRPIGTESGESTARFTVVRVPPGTMPEGRIQFCQHHTPELLWQARWVTHANGATALAAVVLCVADADEAAQRYGRFSGLAPVRTTHGWLIRTAHGSLVLVGPEALARAVGINAPRTPWIAGYTLEVADFEATRRFLRAAAVGIRVLDRNRVLVELPAEVGGAIVFVGPSEAPAW